MNWINILAVLAYVFSLITAFRYGMCYEASKRDEAEKYEIEIMLADATEAAQALNEERIISIEKEISS